MVFSSIIFLFGFLPFVLGIYFLSQNRFRNAVLLCASLFFYAYGERRYIAVMLASIFLNYVFAIWIFREENSRRKKAVLLLGIFLNIAILFLFKYSAYSAKVISKIFSVNLPNPKFHLPLGISFFTFQALSYIIDVYRKKVLPEKNFVNTALYISFFPQLVAGPIVRYQTICEQIKSRCVSLEKFAAGAKRFMRGFCKKVILANNLALASDAALSENLKQLSILVAWLGTAGFALQIYFDFSGYSDMAVGLGKMFGFDFPENFNFPYLAKSSQEFWRRWHITLGAWLRDYVYFPLGGSRVCPARHILNLLCVWILTGVWHGANKSFLIWGLCYFCIIVFEKYFLKIENRCRLVKFFWHIATIFFILILWILFKTESVRATGKILFSMFGAFGNEFCSGKAVRILREYGAFFISAIFLCVPLVPAVCKKILASKNVRFVAVAKGVYLALHFFAFVWAVSFLVLGAHNPFIYFNF